MADELRRGNVLVALEDLGEGRSGDYDENDPNDIPILRFSVYKVGEDNDPNGAVFMDDASYCTQLPANISEELKDAALKIIMDEVYNPIQSGDSIKKLCERLSWISLESLMKNGVQVGEVSDLDSLTGLR